MPADAHIPIQPVENPTLCAPYDEPVEGMGKVGAVKGIDPRGNEGLRVLDVQE